MKLQQGGVRSKMATWMGNDWGWTLRLPGGDQSTGQCSVQLVD